MAAFASNRTGGFCLSEIGKYILDMCKSGNYKFRQTGLLTGECYYHILRDATFTQAVAQCAQNKCQLPVPTSTADNEFIGSIGSTFLGIRGRFDDGVVTWHNIYTKVCPMTTFIP